MLSYFFGSNEEEKIEVESDPESDIDYSDCDECEILNGNYS